MGDLDGQRMTQTGGGRLGRPVSDSDGWWVTRTVGQAVGDSDGWWVTRTGGECLGRLVGDSDGRARRVTQTVGRAVGVWDEQWARVGWKVSGDARREV